ncbi:hypothetical protein DFH11DRAFT_1732247 [Phellopilus nigrolimitatus]|nr:hypothetical protein DFH11DRAFT_1732247 [Phellopilus nigrolimitatus]
MNGSSPESSVDQAAILEQTRRRAYKACLHCRSRKAKCDLGDIDAPSQPPCARCKRERRECVFAPSFRGGKIIKKSSGSNASQGEGEGRGSLKRNEPSSARSATFSTSDIDIDIDADVDQDCRSRSGSDSPPRKMMRMDSTDSERQDDRDRLDPQSLAAASLRNPTDALNLLALAADVDRKNKAKRRDSRAGIDHTGEVPSDGSPAHDGASDYGLGLQTNDSTLLPCDAYHNHHHNSLHNYSNLNHNNGHPIRFQPLPTLGAYALVRARVLSPAELAHLVRHFFSGAHAVFPMVPHHRIPRCAVELARFAHEEEVLLTAIVVIAARQEKMFDVHARSWEYMQTLINEIILGKVVTVGAVEALLLLSENLPRRPEPATEDEEHRMGWMLVGMAVRIGYMLGLDQKTLRPITPSVEEDSSGIVNDADKLLENERLDRERLAWTYCYIFDRSISIRSGKAFWSRGPGLCFQRTHCGMVPSASESFPSLGPIPGVQDDFSAMLQAYTELTQTMASAHDVLYPSKDRTIALNGFRLNWEGKVWDSALVTDCVWTSFHYTRLYIYAFAFQAHVQRGTSTTEDGKKVADNVIFPRGPMGSPDARFILEAIDACYELLHICVERLHPSGAMSYLPWRFFLYFQYAGVFLLKAVFVGAVVPQDQRAIIQLVKKVIVYLACAVNSDESHSGMRYARLLNGLLRVFSRGLDGVTSQVSTPKRHMLSELPPAPMPPSSGATPANGSVSSSTLTSASSSTTPLSAAAPAPSAGPMHPHDVSNHMDSTDAALAHLPMPRLDVNGSVNRRGHIPHSTQSNCAMQHPLASAGDAFYAPSHAGQLSSAPQAHAPAYANSLAAPSYQHGPGPSSHHHQQHAQSQQQQLYAQPQPAPTNWGAGASLNFSQFDLNWPPMEADGLVQMLADDHALDGDFWMSLPNHVQWQTWPQAGGTPAPAPPLN